jgi:hypothetical protein
MRARAREAKRDQDQVIEIVLSRLWRAAKEQRGKNESAAISAIGSLYVPVKGPRTPQGLTDPIFVSRCRQDRVRFVLVNITATTFGSGQSAEIIATAL